MKKNLGNADRLIRTLITIVIVGSYFANVISGWGGIALIVLSIIFLLTSLISFCPLYWLFGLKTNKS